MQSMKKIIIILCLYYASLFSSEVLSSQIDISKKGIALGTFNSLNRAKLLAKRFYAFDIYIKKTTTTTVPYYVVFAVNIPKELQSNVLKDIQRKIPSAYIASDNRIKQLHNDIVKKEQITTKIKKKYIPKELQKPEIDTTKKIISVCFVQTKLEANQTIKKLAKYDCFAKKSLLNNSYIIYVINIEEEIFDKVLKDIQSIYPKAREASKRKIKYFNSNFSQQDIYHISTAVVKKQDSLSPEMLNNYKIAQEQFKNKNYKKSLQLFEELSIKDPNNININFYLGRSYYELKQYEQASAAFERITITDEKNLRARLELAQTYMQLKLNDDALSNFNFVLQNKIPDMVRQNVLAKIAYIKNLKKRSFFSGNFNIRTSYDTNVNNSSGNPTTINYQIDGIEYPFEAPNTIHKEFIYTPSLSLNYIYKLKENYSVNTQVNYTKIFYANDSQRVNDLNASKSDLASETKKEIDIASFSLSNSYYGQNSILTPSFDYSKMKMAKADYMHTVGFGLNYQKKFFSPMSFFGTIKYFQKIYDILDSDNMDSKNIQLLLGNNYPTINYGLFSMIYIYTKEFIKTPDIYGPTSNKSDKRTNTIMLSNKYMLNNRLGINSMISYTNDKKLTTEFPYSLPEHKQIYSISTGVNYKLTRKATLSSGVNCIKNYSNMKDQFGYKKCIVDINFMQTF